MQRVTLEHKLFKRLKRLRVLLSTLAKLCSNVHANHYLRDLLLMDV